MKITYLPTIHPRSKSVRDTGSNSRMRHITRDVVYKNEWDSNLAEEVKKLFDEKAADWSITRNIPARGVPVLDAFERGEVYGQRVVDLGAGTCLATQLLINKFDAYVNFNALTVNRGFSSYKRSYFHIKDKYFSFEKWIKNGHYVDCLLYTSPSPRDQRGSGMAGCA